MRDTLTGMARPPKRTAGGRVTPKGQRPRGEPDRPATTKARLRQRSPWAWWLAVLLVVALLASTASLAAVLVFSGN